MESDLLVCSRSLLLFDQAAVWQTCPRLSLSSNWAKFECHLCSVNLAPSKILMAPSFIFFASGTVGFPLIRSSTCILLRSSATRCGVQDSQVSRWHSITPPSRKGEGIRPNRARVNTYFHHRINNTPSFPGGCQQLVSLIANRCMVFLSALLTTHSTPTLSCMMSDDDLRHHSKHNGVCPWIRRGKSEICSQGT